MANLEKEFHDAIENWRTTWKHCSMDKTLQLYTENVRVMRAGAGLIVGREKLRATLQHFKGVNELADIQFVSDEVSSFYSDDQSLAYQRYHEVLVRQDGSEISTIYEVMIWKKVSGKWLIDMYANCPVPPKALDTTKLLALIQQNFDRLGLACASQNTDETMKCFSDDCVFMPPGECLKGKDSVSLWFKTAFEQKGWGLVSMRVEKVLPVAENYIVSRLVYVTYPTISVHNQSGNVVLRGSGNAVVRLMNDSTSWKIEEAVWNVIST